MARHYGVRAATLLALSLLAGSIHVTGAVDAQDLGRLPDAVERVVASVVAVRVTRPPEPADQKKDAAETKGGSASAANAPVAGLVLSADGYVAVPHHAIRNATQITVAPMGGRPVVAHVVGIDERTDLALLKFTPEAPLVPVHFADSDRLRLGQIVFAIGNAYGLQQSVRLGIVSGLKRDTGSGPTEYIQTDAAVGRGDSGGGLFNGDGELAGMLVAIFSRTGDPVGISFALPSNVLRAVVDQLRATASVERGWLGVRLQDLTADIAATLGLASQAGAVLSEIVPNGPAESGGLKVGDVVLRVGPADTPDSRSVAREIGAYKPGAQVELTIWRERARRQLRVTLGRFPSPGQAGAAPPAAPAPQQSAPAEFGFKVRRSDDGKVVVTEVTGGSHAAAVGLAVGDIVLDAAGRKISAADDLQSVMKGLPAGAPLLLRVQTKRGTVFYAVRPGGASAAGGHPVSDDLKGLDKLE